MLNSNGWGANYRYGKHIHASKKQLYEVDFAYMKHPKESKSYSHTGAKYVEGKKNLAFDLRFSYGQQREIFRKHDVGGVAIRYFYNFGPSVAILKPIYYRVDTILQIRRPEDGSLINYPVEMPTPKKYNTRWQATNNPMINSRASFFKGFSELGIVPGAFVKFGFNFEFSKEDRIVHALEAGIIAEGFIKRIEIMDFSTNSSNPKNVAKNQQLFLTVFVSYRFGRIVDPYEVKKKRERSREISY